MNSKLLLCALLILFSCGKGNHTGKVLNYVPDIGDNDPCADKEECKLVERLSVNDPLLPKKIKKYFPNFKLKDERSKKYKVGQRYFSRKKAIFNQSYNAGEGKFNKGCLISYLEHRTVYKVAKGLINDDGEKLDEVTFKYERLNPKNLTQTKECDEYLVDAYEFNDDKTGWDTIQLFRNKRLNTSSNDEQRTLKKGKVKVRFFVVDWKGKYLIRRIVDIKGKEVKRSIWNPETRRIETFIFTVDMMGITITSPDEFSRYIKDRTPTDLDINLEDESRVASNYEYLKLMVEGELVQKSSEKLISKKTVLVDTSELPEDL